MKNSTLPQSVLPQSVVERLQRERARIENGAFSSSRNVREMLLARAAGYRVLGQVMGVSIYQFVGQWTRSNWKNSGMARLTEGSSYELTAVTAALTTAREMALERLRAQAQLLGATGVVDVQLRLRRPIGASENQNQLEIQAIGSAVTRETGNALNSKAMNSPEVPMVTELFTSNLSAEETWKLERAGYVPCGLVLGNCAIYHQISIKTYYQLELAKNSRFFQPSPPKARRPSTLTARARAATSQWELQFHEMEWQAYDQWKTDPTGNFEINEYTQLASNTRELAVARLQAEAQLLGASGIVGVQVDVDNNPFLQGHYKASHAEREAICAWMATGTAIRCQQRADTSNAPLETVVNMT